MSAAAEFRFPLADADRCVKCGLCLPHCPTYRLSLDEGDSPRGRIALMHGLASGMITASARLEAHLDGCLACRSCEVVCPATVPYGRLIDGGRAVLAGAKPARARLTHMMGYVLTHAWLRRAVGWLLWLYQASRLQQAVRKSRMLGRGRLSRLESYLPRLDPPLRWQEVHPAIGECHGKVSLFIGCVSDLAERQALRDSITLLTRMGYEVRIPPRQGCCGALHLHSGLRDAARKLAEQNARAFAGGSEAIVGTSSGCTATLFEYAELLPASSSNPGSRVQDICAFLMTAKGWERLQFRPLAGTAAVHEPCTLRNVLKQGSSAQGILGRIPQLRVLALPGNAQCCGAAGSYFLTETETADRLATDKLQAIRSVAPDWLVSSNVGCALHMGAALRRAGSGLQVTHPVSLLARQLDPGPGS